VLPDALSYPELVDAKFRYRSLEQAAEMIEAWYRSSSREQIAESCQQRLLPLAIDRVVNVIDQGIERVVATQIPDAIE
jgi:hypothetical protein